MGRQEVRLASLMDHTPGQRQFRDPEKLRTYYRGKNGGLTEAELDAMFAKRIRFQQAHGEDNYRRLVDLAKQFTKPLASHDDTTVDHVRQAIDDGVSIAEFPTTIEAAAGLHEAGIKVMMGAPNLVRGGSHSGNIATVRSRARGHARYPVVRLYPVEPADGGDADAVGGARASILRRRCARSRKHRRKRSASPTVARSRTENAPT